ncbi:SDR family NAD(P)-dependent oxidoreductase [Acuticoccus mangrovi]|uniref:SDR family oxidoreductase n=1 Tax=Acuticoccus mangrovi TaxID=2796142 RepID=A0A934MCT1_9HYPH|nr:SDR family NAD(P)-dependent oxidoreductase [Acuticoccus mangrovi]MBJ3775602.1 SDR family oxidoreductase [Acuticoccus mangrovi]
MAAGTKPVVLITGASNGMGKATAERFLAAGWKVLGLDIVEGAPVGEDCVLRIADITDEDAVKAALTDLPEGYGTLDAMVLVAGVYPVSNLDTFSVDLYRSVFDINVLGTLLLMKYGKEVLADGGSIVTFSTIDALVAVDNQLLYSASKAAVVNATKTVAKELSPRGIRVNGIAPGWVKTVQNMKSGRMERFLPSVPLRRAAEPTEIADLAFWLTTGEGAQYITGETIVTSGGLYMR